MCTCVCTWWSWRGWWWKMVTDDDSDEELLVISYWVIVMCCSVLAVVLANCPNWQQIHWSLCKAEWTSHQTGITHFHSFIHSGYFYSAFSSPLLLRGIRTAIKQHRAVPLLGTVSHLKSALFHRICPARFISSLKLLFSPGPGLGVPLSSYLEVVLYKFHR